jgi:hypothetical protein
VKVAHKNEEKSMKGLKRNTNLITKKSHANKM